MDTLREAEKAARTLLEKGVGTVILTLGERGSLFITETEALHMPVAVVIALDSTGT